MAPRIPAASLTVDLDHFYRERMDPEFLLPEALYKVYYSNPESEFRLKCVEFVLRGEVVEKVALDNDELTTIEKLEEWLEKPVANVGDQTKILHRLRILYGSCTWSEGHGRFLPVTESAYATIEKHLGLPSDFLEVLCGKGARSFKHSSVSSCKTKERRACYNFKYGLIPNDSYFQLALTPSRSTAETNITTCFILSKNQETMSKYLDSILSTISSSSRELFLNPFHLPTIVTSLAIRTSAKRIFAIDFILRGLESELGQHEFKNVKSGNPLEVDFAKKTTQLNFLARRIEVLQLRLGSMGLTLQLLEEWIGLDKQSFGREKADEDFSAALEIIAGLKNARSVTEQRVEFCRKRNEALIAVVYQFMAHNNAKVNVSIADRARKDGIAMKTIAILGMIFLPGTFLAQIFSMPVLNWDDNESSIIKPGFKYYWIGTIISTVCVMMIWTLAMVWPWEKWIKTWVKVWAVYPAEYLRRFNAANRVK